MADGMLGRFDNSYSRIVAVLKVVLPLAALALMSTVFLLSNEIDPSQAIAPDGVDVVSLAAEPRITAANFAGVTDDGAAMSIRAGVARTTMTDALRVEAQDINALIETADGLRTTLEAAHGVIDSTAGLLTLSGGVSIAATPGYLVTTERLTALLDQTRVTALQGINGEGPPGTFTANHMVIEAMPGTEGQYLLVFSGDVKLIYLPQN